MWPSRVLTPPPRFPLPPAAAAAVPVLDTFTVSDATQAAVRCVSAPPIAVFPSAHAPPREGEWCLLLACETPRGRPVAVQTASRTRDGRQSVGALVGRYVIVTADGGGVDLLLLRAATPVCAFVRGNGAVPYQSVLRAADGREVMSLRLHRRLELAMLRTAREAVPAQTRVLDLEAQFDGRRVVLFVTSVENVAPACEALLRRWGGTAVVRAHHAAAAMASTYRKAGPSASATPPLPPRPTSRS